jgi:hypothetical protein
MIELGFKKSETILHWNLVSLEYEIIWIHKFLSWSSVKKSLYFKIFGSLS